MKKRVLLSAFLIAALSLAGCGSSEEQETSAAAETAAAETEASETEAEEEAEAEGSDSEGEKKFIVGMDGATVGYSMLNDEGELEGFEVDVWKEIAERNGYEVEFLQMPFSSLFELVDDGRITTIANLVNPTPERKELYNFSDSYIYEHYVLMSSPDKNVSSLKDLDGMSIGVIVGSANEGIIQTLEEQEGIHLERVNFDDTAINDVVMGKVDLSIQGEGSAAEAVKNIGEDKIKVLIGLGQYSESGYPFAKTEEGDKNREIANETLKEMREDGTLAEISNKWFGVDMTKIPE
ncbi:MAG: transporter substrate-binding domain-containing protein [Candidatus Avilachnospira sp.]|jgi:putative amino-acid transport system substrate-binding protein